MALRLVCGLKEHASRFVHVILQHSPFIGSLGSDDPELFFLLQNLSLPGSNHLFIFFILHRACIECTVCTAAAALSGASCMPCWDEFLHPMNWTTCSNSFFFRCFWCSQGTMETSLPFLSLAPPDSRRTRGSGMLFQTLLSGQEACTSWV